jgi:hypothetical protein
LNPYSFRPGIRALVARLHLVCEHIACFLVGVSLGSIGRRQQNIHCYKNEQMDERIVHGLTLPCSLKIVCVKIFDVDLSADTADGCASEATHNCGASDRVK